MLTPPAPTKVFQKNMPCEYPQLAVWMNKCKCKHSLLVYIYIYLKATPSAAGPLTASWDCWTALLLAARPWGCYLAALGYPFGCIGAVFGCYLVACGCLGGSSWLHGGCSWLLFGCMGCLWLDMLQIAGWLGDPGLRECPQILGYVAFGG